MARPITATEIKERLERGCDCNKCEFCYVKNRIKTKQKMIFSPLIKRTQELLNDR